MELTHQTILITGGSSGFGFEFASKLLALDNTVIITGRDQSKLDQAKINLPGLNIFKSDVSDPDAIKSLYAAVIEQFPGLNILINNAGVMKTISLHDTSIDLDELTREIEINLTGPIRMIQQFLPHLKKMKTAAILNVSSGLALVPFPVSPVYGATKSGLHSYTRSLRVQLKHTKIRVFELLAPASGTPLNDKFMDMEGFDPKILMNPSQLIDVAIKGLQQNQLEIYPGMSRILKIMSRLAPDFLLRQMSKAGAGLMKG